MFANVRRATTPPPAKASRSLSCDEAKTPSSHRVSISATRFSTGDHSLVTHRFPADGMTIKPDASPNAQQVSNKGLRQFPSLIQIHECAAVAGICKHRRMLLWRSQAPATSPKSSRPSVTSPGWFREGIGLLKSAALPIPRSYALMAADLVMGE
jgi:hypothetical protein